MGRAADAPAGFEKIHKILGTAMRAVDAAVWPAKPHLGGPLPVLGTHAQMKVALAIVEHALALFPAPAGEKLGALTTLRAVVAGKRITRDQLQKQTTWGGPSGQVAHRALRAATNHLYASPSARNSIGLHIETAAQLLVLAVLPRGAEAATASLVVIDQAIMQHELLAALEDREIEPSPITRIVSRPGALTLARLSDARYGLWVKIKSRWTWNEGSLDEMFAMVPDALMERVSDELGPAAFRRSRR